MRFQWTEETIAELKQLWEAGTTANEICARMGLVSRSATLGKIWRLGLKGPRSNDHRPVVKRTPKQPRPRTIIVALPPVIEYDPFDAPLEVVENAVNLSGLEPQHCRWPVSGDGLTTLFCGTDKLAHHSYCAHHFHIAHDRRSNTLTAEQREIRRQIAARSFRKRRAA